VLRFTKPNSQVAVLSRRFGPGANVIINGSELRFPPADVPDPQAEALRAFEGIRNTTDPAPLEAFVRTYKDSPVAALAQERLQTLLWAAVNKNNGAELAQFRQRFPNSAFAREAAGRIAHLELAQVDQNNAGALADFAARHAGTDAAQVALGLTDRIRQRQKAAAEEKAAVDRIAAEKILAQQQSEARSKIEAAAVLAALKQYEAAFSERSSAMLKASFPNISRKDLADVEAGFQGAERILVALAPVSAPEVNGTTASVVCERTSTVERGRRRQMTKPQRVRVNLSRQGDRWVISGITGE
jgi:hypothetical protein